MSFDIYAAYACLTVPESRIAFTFKLIAGLLVLSVLACIWRMAGGVFGLNLGFSPTLPWLFWIATSIVIFSMVTMLLALNASQRLQDEINHQAHHDALTGAYNSVGSLLAKLKLTPQKPLQSAYQRDPEAIERWQRDTFPAMAKQSKAEGAEIPFFGTNRVFVPMPSMARRGLSVARPR